MKDPKRLLHSPASELERRVLRAGAAEQPPTAALRRLTDRLGIDPAARPSITPRLAAAKLMPFALVGLGVMAGLGWRATRSATPEPPASAVHAQHPETTPPAPEAPAPHARMKGKASRTLNTVSPTAVETTPAPGDPRALAQEIARIDAVRALLSDDRADAALGALQRYARDFPGGALRQEAAVLRIEASERAGHGRRARALAARFLAENPASPHAARVRDLLGELGRDAR